MYDSPALRIPALDNVNDPLSLLKPVNAYVNVSPLSTSKPLKDPITLPIELFSLISLRLNVRPCGVSLTFTMSTSNSLTFVKPPSSVTLLYNVY